MSFISYLLYTVYKEIITSEEINDNVMHLDTAKDAYDGKINKHCTDISLKQLLSFCLQEPHIIYTWFIKEPNS